MENAESLTGNFNADCEKSVFKVANGDISALSQLYGCLKKPVFLLAYSITGDYSLAQDVMQETFLRVNEKASTYRGGTSPKAWILEIARNLSLNCIKKRGREELSADEPVIKSANAEDKAVADADFTRAVAVLDSDERNIVVMKISGSLKHSEIARIMGISVGDTRIRYWRALKKLKGYYGANGKR